MSNDPQNKTTKRRERERGERDILTLVLIHWRIDVLYIENNTRNMCVEYKFEIFCLFI